MYRPILFCDFDGTICHDKYWRSLPRESYEMVEDLLFRNDTTYVNDWMRGKYSAEEANRVVAQALGMPYEKVWQLFVNDCNTMQVSKKTLEKLSTLRSRYTVILMTGNMDSFSRFTVPSLGLDKYFDYISNSHYEGKNKTDNHGEIFVEYASKLGVPLQECVVIDDSAGACAMFEELGGTAHVVTPQKDIDYYLALL